MISTLGWLGSILFALCAIPQAIKACREKHARGLDWTFLAMWFFGEVFCTIYAIDIEAWPLVFNYVFNLISLCVIIYYKGRDTYGSGI